MGWALQDLFQEQKTAIPSAWAEDERGRQRMNVALEINGATVEGLFLRATAIRSLADREVMFQLEYRPVRGAGDSLCRIDWRPIRPHRNPKVGPKPLRLLEISGSHHHSFGLNFLPQEDRMRVGNLPLAEPLEDPLGFRQLLAVTSNAFRISGLSGLPLPSWDLLL